MGAVAVDASGAGEENKEEVFSVPKPRTQDQFDRDMEALYRQYGGDTVAYSAKYAEEERKWKNEVTEYNRKVEEWNESHADSPQSTITIEDDSGVDGNDEISDDWKTENDNEGDIKFGNFKEGDEEKLLEMYGDTGYEDKEEYKNADGSDIVDDHCESISDQEVNDATRKAKDEDSDDLDDLIEGLAGTVWADPVAAVESMLTAKASEMVNTNKGSEKIDEKFFPFIIQSLPFFNDHVKAYEDFKGTPAWTESQDLKKVKTSSFDYYRSLGWTITVLRGRKHGKADIRLTREHEATGLYADDIDETSTEPDWQELPEAPDNYLDEENFAAFDWSFGGFKGGDAVWGGDPGNGSGPVIGNLKMGKDGLSFTYENGLAGWGLEKDDASALACLFVKDNDGNWVGGKFDWISTSRQTRDFKNIYSGYNGWDLSNVPKTTTVAFVIVSKNGKWRSNVITALWER